MMGTQKYLRESCYHHIKYLAARLASLLAAFMWRKPLNSNALTTATHRKPKIMLDGTGTQIRVQMANKYKIKMTQRELYNMRDPQ